MTCAFLTVAGKAITSQEVADVTITAERAYTVNAELVTSAIMNRTLVHIYR